MTPDYADGLIAGVLVTVVAGCGVGIVVVSWDAIVMGARWLGRRTIRVLAWLGKGLRDLADILTNGIRW